MYFCSVVGCSVLISMKKSWLSRGHFPRCLSVRVVWVPISLDLHDQHSQREVGRLILNLKHGRASVGPTTGVFLVFIFSESIVSQTC